MSTEHQVLVTPQSADSKKLYYQTTTWASLPADFEPKFRNTGYSGKSAGWCPSSPEIHTRPEPAQEPRITVNISSASSLLLLSKTGFHFKVKLRVEEQKECFLFYRWSRILMQMCVFVMIKRKIIVTRRKEDMMLHTFNPNTLETHAVSKNETNLFLKRKNPKENKQDKWTILCK